MNVEVSFEIGPDAVIKYSVTPEGTIYEIRKTGWRKVRSELVRQTILQRLRESHASISA